MVKYWVNVSFANIIEAKNKKEAKEKVIAKISKEGYIYIGKTVNSKVK